MASFCNPDGGGARTYASGTSVSSAMPAEAIPLLRLPSAEASIDEWASLFPMSELPEMPQRTSTYWHEPCCGVCLVGFLSVMFCCTTINTAVQFITDTAIAASLEAGILLCAVIACGSVAFILFGKAGELNRSQYSCYPVPEEVARRLVEGKKDMTGLDNIRGVHDGRTYCVRCFLWRPSETSNAKCHHCNVCQRCVTGFDHHCGVFGRCIVSANMPCFVALIAMLFCAMVVTGAAFCLSPDEMYNEPSRYQRPIEVNRGFMASPTPFPQYTPGPVTSTR